MNITKEYLKEYANVKGIKNFSFAYLLNHNDINYNIDKIVDDFWEFENLYIDKQHKIFTIFWDKIKEEVEEFIILKYIEFLFIDEDRLSTDWAEIIEKIDNYIQNNKRKSKINKDNRILKDLILELSFDTQRMSNTWLEWFNNLCEIFNLQN